LHLPPLGATNRAPEMDTKIQAVLFDYGGTLDSDGVPWFQRFLAVYRTCGLDIGEEAFALAFYASDDNLRDRHALTQLGLEPTVRLQVEDVLALMAPDRADLIAPVTQAFVTQTRRKLEENRPILENLRREGYRLGIVSNFYGNLEAILTGENLRGLFDVVADSAVVGATKPDPAIFRAATDALGLCPERACMVGDSIARDMNGAHNLRMPHVLLSRATQACCDQAPVIRNLSGLAEALDQWGKRLS